MNARNTCIGPGPTAYLIHTYGRNKIGATFDPDHGVRLRWS